MKKNEFVIGQRVKQKDPDEGYMCYGHVTKLSDESVTVLWNDPEWGEMECEHFEDEYDSIKPGNPDSSVK